MNKLFENERDAFIWGFAFGVDYGYEDKLQEDFNEVSQGYYIMAGLLYDRIVKKETKEDI